MLNEDILTSKPIGDYNDMVTGIEKEAGVMVIEQHFDLNKAIEVLLYVSSRCSDKYKALKVLYFADRDHLSKYGRLICGDRYAAMKHGPVPSHAYDLVQMASDEWPFEVEEGVKEALATRGYEIVPLRKPNTELLSSSEIECLDEAIDKYGNLSFTQLKTLSHQDPAFKAADQNDLIPMEALVKSVPDGDLLWEHLTSD